MSPSCKSILPLLFLDSITLPFVYLLQLEDLMRITDAGSDWQVDSLLKDSCSSVVETACKSPDTNQAGVISCLMDK